MLRTLIVIGVVGVIILLALISVIRNFKKGNKIGCNCEGSNCKTCHLNH